MSSAAPGRPKPGSASRSPPAEPGTIRYDPPGSTRATATPEQLARYRTPSASPSSRVQLSLGSHEPCKSRLSLAGSSLADGVASGSGPAFVAATSRLADEVKLDLELIAAARAVGRLPVCGTRHPGGDPHAVAPRSPTALDSAATTAPRAHARLARCLVRTTRRCPARRHELADRQRTRPGPAHSLASADATDRTAVGAWMAGYLKAWSSNDPAQRRGPVHARPIYRRRPHSEGWRGREAIVAGWLAPKDGLVRGRSSTRSSRSMETWRFVQGRDRVRRAPSDYSNLGARSSRTVAAASTSKVAGSPRSPTPVRRPGPEFTA